MKMGYCIGVIRSNNGFKIVMSSEEIVMEEFMMQYDIEESADVWVCPMTQSKEYAERFKDTIEKVSVNDTLKNMSLMTFLAKVVPPGILPEPEELEKKNECGACDRNLPEPDGFMGVIGKDNVLRCFECYLKNEEGK